MTNPIIFWLITILVVGSALAVVLLRNIVHSALFLIVTFVGVSGLYILLQADFLAAVQLLVYAGAVAILIVFGVMLTVRGDIKNSNMFNSYKLSGGIVALVFFLIVERIILKTDWVLSTAAMPESTVGPIADSLLGNFVIPFEVAAVLLLVAMVGAILLARGRVSPNDYVIPLSYFRGTGIFHRFIWCIGETQCCGGANGRRINAKCGKYQLIGF